MSDNVEEDVQAFREALGAFYPELDEGTVLRFKVRFDHDEDGSKAYSYAAIWAGGKWYTSGVSTVIPKDCDHADLMRALAKYKAFDIELATEFEPVR